MLYLAAREPEKFPKTAKSLNRLKILHSSLHAKAWAAIIINILIYSGFLRTFVQKMWTLAVPRFFTLNDKKGS